MPQPFPKRESDKNERTDAIVTIVQTGNLAPSRAENPGKL